jgi:hypothetical protein
MKTSKKAAALLALVIVFGCVSTGSHDSALFDNAEISAMAALGQMDKAFAGPLYEKDGGKDLRLAVLAPILRGADTVDEWLPGYAQGFLHTTLGKYSAMTLFDRQHLDQIIKEQNLAANMRFSDEDYIKIGQLINVQYFLTGSMQKLSDGEFAVSFSITESSSGVSRASFMRNGTPAMVRDGTLLNAAAESLLAQMGVTLTETGSRTLRTGRYMTAHAEAGYARGVAAEASGSPVEALLNYSQAVAFDPFRIEALTRLGSVSSEISGGSISASILNDLQARDAWLEAFKEAAAFFNNHPPFEINYDPNLLRTGDTDYDNRRANLAMRIGLTPSGAGFGALNALLEGLEKTGKRERWGFAGWPFFDITPKKEPAALLFPGKRSFSFTVEAGLVNETGKVIARGETTLKTGKIDFKAGDTALWPPDAAFGQIDFPKVKVEDLTPTLTVVITGVNTLSARQINETGYIRIAPGDVAQMQQTAVQLAQAQTRRQGRPQDLADLFDTEGVTATFNAVHAFLQTCDNGSSADRRKRIVRQIMPGDWIDLPQLTIQGDVSGGAINTGNVDLGGNGKLLRLIVVGINSFAATNKDAPAHIVFQFQNIPGTYRMNASNTNAGGYKASEIRRYLTDAFLRGLAAAGVPEGVLYAPIRYIANAGDGAAAADALTDLLWLPTERELFGENSLSNKTWETAANQARFEYYKGDTQRKKYNAHNNTMWWWEASPSSGSAAHFSCVSY